MRSSRAVRGRGLGRGWRRDDAEKATGVSETEDAPFALLCNPTTKESSISSAKLCSFASTTFAPVVTTAARAEVDVIPNTARAATAARTATIARKTRDATLRTRPGARSAARVRVSVAGLDESLLK